MALVSFVVGDLVQLVDQFRGQDVTDPVPGHRGRGAEANRQMALAGAESPIRPSGSPLRTPAQLVRVWSMAGLTLGLASKVEFLEPLLAGEVGSADAAFGVAPVAFVALGQERNPR